MRGACLKGECGDKSHNIEALSRVILALSVPLFLHFKHENTIIRVDKPHIHTVTEFRRMDCTSVSPWTIGDAKRTARIK